MLHRAGIVFAIAASFAGCANGGGLAGQARFWAATGTTPVCNSAGKTPLVVRSDDGGMSWITVASPGDADSRPPIQRLSFADRLHGFAIADFRLWRTGDGGDSWEDATEGLAAPGTDVIRVSDVAFTSFGRAIAVGIERISHNDGTSSFRPLLALTLDGGGLWTRSEIPPLGASRSSDLSSACLSPSGLGLAVGSDVCRAMGCGQRGGQGGDLALVTTDGGTTWRDVTDLAGVGVGSSAYCAGHNELWADKYYLYGFAHSMDAGETWEDESLPVTEWEFPVNQRLSFADSLHGWFTALAIARSNEKLLATSNAGVLWAEQPLPPLSTDEILNAVHFITVDVGVAVGGSGLCQSEPAVAFATGDAGRIWTRGTLPERARGLSFEVVAGVED